jgi:hypothetical protein
VSLFERYPKGGDDPKLKDRAGKILHLALSILRLDPKPSARLTGIAFPSARATLRAFS